MGWFKKALLVAVVGYVGYGGYGYYRGGYFNLPELPDGAYTISFKNGLRAIVLDAEVANPGYADAPAFFRRLSAADPDRSYLGLPFDVPPWFADDWSTCAAPSEEERTYYEENMPEETKRDMIGARFDAVCYLDVEGGRLPRGLIYSVKKQ